jgi:tetratricopeptide (TPR) repeat protein
MWRRRSRDEFAFVEAGPTLGERFAEAWHGRGIGRLLRLLWLAVTLPMRVIGQIISPLLWWRHTASDGVLATRSYFHLLQGLPAVLAAIAVLAVAGVVVGRESSLRESYRIAAATAYQADRPEDAQLFYERLFRLDGGTAETRLFLGLTLEKLGHKEEATGLIYGVANGDAGGDARANRWLAGQILSNPKNLQDRSQLNAAYKHLLKAEEALPRDPDIKLNLATYHLALGETAKAIPKLEAAASTRPALHYDLSRLYATTGQAGAAQRANERAEKHFRRELEKAPDDRRARLLLATCVANAGRFEEAVKILAEGLSVDPDGPYGSAIAKIYVSAYDRHSIQPQPDYRAMINALREALRFDPKSADAAVRLATFGERGAGQLGIVAPTVDPTVEKTAREMLQALLASGEQPPAVHMALGLKAWRANDLSQAQWHFERAYELDPNLSGVANNLAWVMSHQPNGDLKRALEVIDPIITKFPQVAHFRDTRGEIYLRMERWDEALQDLERALPEMRNDPRIHESLATAYDGVKQPEIAEKHRQEAAKLKTVKPEK